MILDLRAAVRELYGTVPAQFVRRRAQLAAEAKDHGKKELAAEILALRKPTVAAWAVNTLVRNRREALEQFREFATLLREAQRTLDADQLRALGRERARRVDELAALAAEVAAEEGQKLTGATVLEVQDTLVALLADEDAEQAVLSGALVKPLSYSGFGSVDIEDAVPALSLVTDPDNDNDDDNDDDNDTDNDTDTEAAEDADDVPGAPDENGGGSPSAASARQRARARERILARIDAADSELAAAERRLEIVTARHVEVVEGIADLERRLSAARGRLDKAEDALQRERERVEHRAQARREAVQSLTEHDEATQ